VSACRVCTARASLCSAVMWRSLATHSILLFSLHLFSRTSPCTITFQTQSKYEIEQLATAGKAGTKSKADFPCSIEDRAGHIQQLSEFKHAVIKTDSECSGRHATHWRHPLLLEYGGFSRNSVGVPRVIERTVGWESLKSADHRL